MDPDTAGGPDVTFELASIPEPTSSSAHAPDSEPALGSEPQESPSEAAEDFPVPLAPGVRVRRARDCVLLLAPDGVTALAFDDAEVAVLATGAGPESEELLEELTDGGFLEGTSAVADPGGARLTRTGLEISGLDGLVTCAHPVTSRISARVVMGTGVVLTIVTGFAVVHGSAHASAGDAGLGPLTAAALLVVTGLVLAAVHELGHALALIRAGGRIGRAGFGFHWGAPSFYVDSTAALFLPRRQRIGQAAAGVISEIAFAAALVAIAALSGSGRMSFIAGSAMLYALSSLVVNGAPVLGLDGSLILSDLLDRPTLPTGSGRASGRFALVYRSLDAVVGLVAVIASTWLWWMIWRDVLAPLWDGGIAGRAVVGLAAAPTVAAIVVGLASLTRR